MIPDYATTERRELIDLADKLKDHEMFRLGSALRMLAESREAGLQMADRLMALQLRIDRAVNWLDLGAPGRARETLLEG